MSSLAEVLEFKFPGIAGIRTREGSNGGMEIFDWPGPGAAPTQNQIAAWRLEYENRTVPMPPPDADEMAARIALLEDKTGGPPGAAAIAAKRAAMRGM